MGKLGLMIFGCAVVAAAAGCSESSQSPPPPPPGSIPLTLQTVASGLDAPLFLTAPPNDTDRLFVVEQTGRIKIIRGGQVLPTPFLDLRGKISSGGERGVLGLAFHPEYATNGLFAVNYTNPSGDTRVGLFKRSTGNPDVADPASEQLIFEVEQPFPNHNGGMLIFRGNGDIYIGTGDGGSGGDPQGNGQNRNSLLGKIIRLNVNAAGIVAIPTDNPFTNQAERRPEIWAYGLRNPWRFSFDRETGDLYVADVGQGAWEEVNVSTTQTAFARGANFGWNTMEGNHCYSPSSNCNQTGLTLPVTEYGHDIGCSITGGYVYRGSAIPSIQGLYFYADYCGGWIRSFRFSTGAAADPFEWPALAPGGSITSFGEDAAGELYVLTSGGRVAKIVSSP